MLKANFFNSTVIAIILNILQISAFGQTSYSNEVYNVIFKHDFENNTPGNYLDSEWKVDWNNPPWVNRDVPAEIIDDPESAFGSSKFMRFYFPAGGTGPSEGGGQWLTTLENAPEELYFSYNLRFKVGFEGILGGKVPGLRGGPLWEGFNTPPWDAGFVALLMWTGNNHLKFYYYHQDLSHEYGDTQGIDFYFTPGEWHNVTQRVVLNTIGDNGGNNDGILEAYIDGTLVSQVTGIRFRNLSSIKIDQLYLTAFYGGGGPDYAPHNDQWLDLDDFVAFNYQQGVDVVRGNNINPIGTQLIFPFASTFNPIWQKSIKASPISARSVKISWLNYSSPGEYTLERRSENETDYTVISQIPYGTTSYNDNTAQPGTKYYYRVITNWLYSTEVSVSTPPLNLPTPPSNLNYNDVYYRYVKLVWSDNSSNELGFELWRKTFSESDYSKIATLGSDINNFTDTDLSPGIEYNYQVRAFNLDGFSTNSDVLEVSTLYLEPPVAPSMLHTTENTEKSISVSWNDNSINESKFLITRTLAADTSVKATMEVNANDTSYTDEGLDIGTVYFYTVKAVNDAWDSPCSNKNITATLSKAELKRYKEGLVAYYNFKYNPDYVIYDLSGFGEPVNLRVVNRPSVAWNENDPIALLSSSALVSYTPASKIIQALKKTNAITLECWIKPMESAFSNNSGILALSNSNNEVGFALNQDIDNTADNKSIGYHVRLQTSSSTTAGYPEFAPDHNLTSIGLEHIAYIRDSLGNESFYINGVKSSEGFRPDDFSSWKDNFYLTLGNDLDMNHAWTGSYYSVAIFNNALTESQITTNFSAGPVDSLCKDPLDFQVSIYPNPTTDYANLVINPIVDINEIVPQTSIRLLDTYGKIIFRENIFNPYVQYYKKLDFKDYTSGVYFLQVISGANSKTSKIIVQ